MGSLFVAVLVVIVLVSLFYKSNDNHDKEEKEKKLIAKLKARYQDALHSGNKEQALKFGRDYYSYLRNTRTLKPSDEQTIARDVADMDFK